jgi:hypothetical protein
VPTTYPAQTGRTLRVPVGASLQRAIDTARLGDVIVLQAGATYRSGSEIMLRNKTTGTGWIVIRTSTPDSLLPQGTRVLPKHASRLARIVITKGIPVVRTLAGAHHYRLVGLELTVDSALVPEAGTLVALGTAGAEQDVADEVPHNLVLDRVWVHAWANTQVRRCVGLNSAWTAVIDSYLSECHNGYVDSQALGGFNGPGPFKIANNYLEGAAEVIMFGGASPSLPGVVPSDIEIRGNHITRPVSWKDKWLVKNLFELKTGQRILLEGNVLENNWQHGQVGFAILIKSVNDGGSCPQCGSRDIVIRHNRIRRTPAGVNIGGTTSSSVVQVARIEISRNVFELNDPDPTFTGSTRSMQVTGGATDVHFTKNTIIDSPSTMLMLDGTPMPRFAFTNNIAVLGTYGIDGSGVASGTGALTQYAPGATVAGNVLIGTTSSTYPAGNYFPGRIDLVGFVDYVRKLYALATTSPYRLKATDGTDPGPSIPTLDALVGTAITAP